MKKVILLSLVLLFCGCVAQDVSGSNDSAKKPLGNLSFNETINESTTQPELNITMQTDSNITGQLLMAFHACDMSSVNCFDPRNHYTYVAESDDGKNWTMVPGYVPHSASVPDLIRRGNTLYVFNPGMLRRYHFDTMIWDDPVTMIVKRPDGTQEMIVDPSPIIDDEGNIVLFYMVGQGGSDPAQCPPGVASCTKYFRSATEKMGSDGSEFIVDSGDRLVISIDSPGMASDPDIFENPDGFVMLVSRGQDVQAFASSELRGSYGSTGLSNNFLSFGSGGVPAGYYDPKGSYWIFVHKFEGNAEVIKRAIHPSLSIDIMANSFKTLISGEDFPQLGETFSVASPGFTLNQE